MRLKSTLDTDYQYVENPQVRPLTAGIDFSEAARQAFNREGFPCPVRRRRTGGNPFGDHAAEPGRMGGVDVNKCTCRHGTLPHGAARAAKILVLRALFACGAHENRLNYDGQTAHDVAG